MSDARRPWLDEPTTALTDYLLAALAFAFGAALVARAEQLTPALAAWVAAFALMGAAAVTGGTVHGFASRLDDRVHRALWTVTVWLLGGASTLFLAAVLAARLPAAGAWIFVAAALKLALFVAWTARHDEFRFVVYDQVATLVLMAAVLVGTQPGMSASSTRWIVGASALLLGAGAVQRSGFALHRHLNHNDLSHLVQMAAVYLLYRGGLALAAVTSTAP